MTVTMKDQVRILVERAGPSGLRPVDLQRALADLYPGHRLPHIRTLERWLRSPDYWKPSGHGFYALRGRA